MYVCMYVSETLKSINTFVALFFNVVNKKIKKIWILHLALKIKSSLMLVIN